MIKRDHCISFQTELVLKEKYKPSNVVLCRVAVSQPCATNCLAQVEDVTPLFYRNFLTSAGNMNDIVLLRHDASAISICTYLNNYFNLRVCLSKSGLCLFPASISTIARGFARGWRKTKCILRTFRVKKSLVGKGPFEYYVIMIFAFWVPTQTVCNQTLLTNHANSML